MGVSAPGDWERASNPLELEFQEIVSHLTWVLRTELRSSARARNSLRVGVTSPNTPGVLSLPW